MSGTTAGTTSGTVLAYAYPQRVVLDRAFRKAGRVPQDISSEWIVLAQSILFAQLSEYAAVGFPLWTRQELPLSIAIGKADVPLPYGTVEAMHAYWRSFNPWRGAAVDSNGISVSALLAGQPNDDISIDGPNPGVIVDFGSDIELDTVGVLPGLRTGWLLDGNGDPVLDGHFNPILGSPASYSATLEVLVSLDGVSWINVQTLPTVTLTGGVWSYFDLNPSITARYVQVLNSISGPWTLNQINLCLANSTQVDLGLQNMDDYYDLPNKFFQGGQPNTVYVDRMRDSPVIKIWPTPNTQAFYGGTIVSLCRRYIQDPGSMTDSLEIPARWIEGVTSRLGVRLIDELPDPDKGGPATAISAAAMVERRKNLEASAMKAEAIMWSSERSQGVIRLTPNLRPYTV